MKQPLATPIRLIGFLLLLVSAQAEPAWQKLKVGMSSDEALQYLGEPLIRTKARGLERWIYDGAGEVCFYGGPIKFWTVAAPTPASDAKPVETDVMFRPARTSRFPATQQATSTATVEPAAIDGPRFRYR